MANRVDETFEARQRLLRRCLDKLTDHQHRSCVRLRYFTGSSLEKIAADTGKQINAIKQVLFRAGQSLIDCIQAGLAEEAVP